MAKSVFTFLILLILLFGQSKAGNIYRWPLGAIEIAVPANINELNLYHFSQNSAWLQASDSTNWMTVALNSQNSWGTLRRWWDAYGVHKNSVYFSGQKHVADNQAFYGSVAYNMDYLTGVNRAIEIEPYGPDPFVPCDSVEGNFSYIGPQVEVVFSHKVLKHVWWGAGLHYQIYRGLKEVYSMPEIIRRKIRTDLSLAVRFSPSVVLGFSLRPFDVLDIIKIEKQPDGTSPVIFRYRGEFIFTAATSTDDRNTRTKGIEAVPQIMFDFARLKGVVHAGYKYGWQEVYDSPLVRKYDGYYYGENYYFSTVWRYFFTKQLNSGITLRYRFRYLEDWAEEPVKRLAIYRSFQRFHELAVGASRRLGALHPLILALEGRYHHLAPDKRDYLAKVFRHESIKGFTLKMGALYSPYPRWYVHSAIWYQVYHEPDIWNYYGDYQGPGGFLGISFHQMKSIWLINLEFAGKKGIARHRSRDQINLQIELRKFL